MRGLWKITFGIDGSDNYQADNVIAETAEIAVAIARGEVLRVSDANEEEEAEIRLTGVQLIGRETIAP